MDQTASLIAGAILLLLGVTLGYRFKRRRFNRMNEYGVERFPSYGRKLAARFVDGLMWFGALVCLLSGAMVIGVAYMDTWGWILVAPVALWLIFPFIWK
jgi:hypothetical protein